MEKDFLVNELKDELRIVQMRLQHMQEVIHSKEFENSVEPFQMLYYGLVLQVQAEISILGVNMMGMGVGVEVKFT